MILHTILILRKNITAAQSFQEIATAIYNKV